MPNLKRTMQLWLRQTRQQMDTQQKTSLRPVRLQHLRGYLESLGFEPDIVYSTACDYRSLETLQAILHMYDYRLPVIQHFYDYFGRGEDTATRQLLQQLSPSLTRVWSINQSMAEAFAPLIGTEIPVVGVFHCDVPASYKKHHRDLSADFTAVMLGNIWMPETFFDLQAAWRWLGDQIEGIRPITWYGHERSFQRIQKNQRPIDSSVIQYAGFLPANELEERLREADLAMVLFNREHEPESDYARFALPSRITELASAGLPVFFAAGDNTEPARLAKRAGIGVSAAPADPEHFRQTLLAFAGDTAHRAACGARSRQLAEQEYDISKYRPFLYTTLIQLVQEARRNWLEQKRKGDGTEAVGYDTNDLCSDQR
ncbi:MAG: glycosyltransferase family 4 protein [Chloroflexaceae bacterium]|nr:glycosyltransferase family 4 protein [Chloroflexaceae bacterium]